MAKNHVFSRVTVKMGDKDIPITNFINIRYGLEYSYKSDKEALSNDMYHIFDLETTVGRMIEIFKNEVTVKWQNGYLRKHTDDVIEKEHPRGSVVNIAHVYPGKRVRVVKMTEDDIVDKAKKDPEYKEKLLALLGDL